MSFQRLIGQKELKIRLKNEFMGTPPHACIFSGPKGIGKHEFAREYAKALMCSEPNEHGACGKCNNCNYFEAGSHPDYIQIFDPSHKNIKVDDVRAKVISDVRICPQISKRKVYLIEGDELNEAGENVLLKSLEEPPENVIFIIICEDSSRMLPTVLSRTVEFKLKNYSKGEIMEVLKKINREKHEEKFTDEELTFTSEFSSGVIGKAIDLLGDEELPAMRDEMINLVTHIGSEDYATVLSKRYKYFDDNSSSVGELLLLLLWIIGDLSILKKDKERKDIINSDKRMVLLKFLRDNPKVDMNRLSRASGHIHTVFKRMEVNISSLYTINDMLLGLKKEFNND